MLELPQILLAQNDDNGPMRFIGILVIVGIFILGNLLQWLQKYQQQKQKQELQRRAQPPPPPPGIQQQMHQKARRPFGLSKTMVRPAPPHKPGTREQNTTQRTATQTRVIYTARKVVRAPGQVPVARRPVPPVPARPAPAQVRPGTPPPQQAGAPEATAPAPSPRPPATTARTNVLQKLLRSRSAVRQVYVLSEILQPPVSIREPRV